MPMPGDDVFDAGEDLFRSLEHMHDLLVDPELTSVRVVLTLEQVVIKEAQRSFTYFHLYGYPTDLVIANRVLPDAVGWKYFRGWYERSSATARWSRRPSRRSRSAARRSSTARWSGCRSSRELGQQLYGEADPTAAVLRRPAVRGGAAGRRVRPQRRAAVRDQGARSRSRATPTSWSSTWAPGGVTSSCRASWWRRRHWAPSSTTIFSRFASPPRREARMEVESVEEMDTESRADLEARIGDLERRIRAASGVRASRRPSGRSCATSSRRRRART